MASDWAKAAVNQPSANHVGRSVERIIEREAAMASETPASPSVADGALWCQPGDTDRARVWMVFFEDPDKGLCVFDNEAEAREFWARATLSWNCYLFQAAPVDATTHQRTLEALRDLVQAADKAVGHITGYGEASTARLNLRAALARIKGDPAP